MYLRLSSALCLVAFVLFSTQALYAKPAQNANNRPAANSARTSPRVVLPKKTSAKPKKPAQSQNNQSEWKFYNFPNNSSFLTPDGASRAAAGCTTGVGGTAIYPEHAPTGKALCDAEAQKRGINPDFIKWYASPVFNTWGTPEDNKLCKYENKKMSIVNGKNGGGKWTNVVICEYEPFDCGEKWSYELEKL